MSTQELMDWIASLSPEYKRVTPFPQERELSHDKMIALIDRGWLGMDGFKYQFREYAEYCWKVCHGRNLKLL